MSTFTAEDLRVAISAEVESVAAPVPDLGAVHRRVRRRRSRQVGVGVLVAASLAVGGFALARQTPDPVDRSQRYGFSDSGPLDLTQGARAYAADGKTLHVGGRTYGWPSSVGLDTEAAATAYGLVFPGDRGIPQLLDADGDVVALDDAAAESDAEFHPTLKTNGDADQIAYALLQDGAVTLKVLDLARREVTASTDVPCDDCAAVKIDAFDDGRVFLRTTEGTLMWTSGTDEVASVAGPGTRVADVRNQVMLYDGKPPDLGLDGWTTVNGSVDSQLSPDGAYVLSWSSTLIPTGSGPAVVLDEGSPKGQGYSFWTFDTDGSVLVATAKKYPHVRVYDCEVPSGQCTDLGPLEANSGDPVFVGNDM